MALDMGFGASCKRFVSVAHWWRSRVTTTLVQGREHTAFRHVVMAGEIKSPSKSYFYYSIVTQLKYVMCSETVGLAMINSWRSANWCQTTIACSKVMNLINYTGKEHWGMSYWYHEEKFQGCTFTTARSSSPPARMTHTCTDTNAWSAIFRSEIWNQKRTCWHGRVEPPAPSWPPKQWR